MRVQQAFLSIAAAFAAAMVPARADQIPLHTLAVQGEAATYVTPDHASVEVGVITQSKVVGDAVGQNNIVMTRVLEALRALEIKDAQIQTSSFGVQPRYPSDSNGRIDESQPIVGYLVENKITVGVDDTSKVGRIIDVSSAAGANSASQVRFQVKNRSTYLDTVRKAAVANARHKAEILAAAAGAKVGQVLAINDNRATYYRNEYEDVETVVVTGSRMPATPIAPGQQEIGDTVTVIFALK